MKITLFIEKRTTNMIHTKKEIEDFHKFVKVYIIFVGVIIFGVFLVALYLTQGL
jgi:hypothetical protein